MVQARAIGYCRLTRAPTPFLGGDAETHAISCAGDDQRKRLLHLAVGCPIPSDFGRVVISVSGVSQEESPSFPQPDFQPALSQGR